MTKLKKWYVAAVVVALVAVTFFSLFYHFDSEGAFSGSEGMGALGLFSFITTVPLILTGLVLFLALIGQFSGSTYWKGALWRSFGATILFWIVLFLAFLIPSRIKHIMDERSKEKEFQARIERQKEKLLNIASQLDVRSAVWNSGSQDCSVILRNGEKFSFSVNPDGGIIIRKDISNLPAQDTSAWLNATYNPVKPFLSAEALKKADSLIQHKGYCYQYMQGIDMDCKQTMINGRLLNPQAYTIVVLAAYSRYATAVETPEPPREGIGSN